MMFVPILTYLEKRGIATEQAYPATQAEDQRLELLGPAE
jgi:hypothetical protein